MNNTIYQAAQRVLRSCLAVQPSETLLFVTDSGKIDLARMFQAAARDLGLQVILMEGPVQEGGEPPLPVAAALLEADTAMLLTSGSLTHTHARGAATQKGVRIASLPRITEEVVEMAFDVDYEEMGKVTGKLTELLTKASSIHVVTALGTDLSFSVKGRQAMPDAGDLSYRGAVGNLPAGEAMISPLEGQCHGKLVVDGVIAGVGVLRSPLTFILENGRITAVTGEQAQSFSAYTDAYDINATSLAEFGIGTNPRCRITGNPLSDEKVYQTVHFGFGNNLFMGGAQDSNIHYDCIVTKPTVYLDGTCIMKEGEYRL